MGIMALAAAPFAYGWVQIGILIHLTLLILVALLTQLRFSLVKKSFVARDMGIVAQDAIALAYRRVDEFVCESASVMTVKTVLRSCRDRDCHQQQDE